MDAEDIIRSVKKSLALSNIKLSDEERIYNALRKVDRKDFIDPSFTLEAITVDADPLAMLSAVYQDMQDNISGKKEGQIDLGFIRDNVNLMINKVGQVLNSARQFKVPLTAIAYNDKVIDIGEGQTCSQPLVTYVMMDALKLEYGMNVLEIGGGCGYSAAIAAELVGEKGYVTTVEIIPKLNRLAHKNLRKHFGDSFVRRVWPVNDDGSGGYPEHGPYDRIYLTAGVDLKTFDKTPFIEQLKPEGILVYPEEVGFLFSERYENGVLKEQKKHLQVIFVPLITKQKVNV